MRFAASCFTQCIEECQVAIQSICKLCFPVIITTIGCIQVKGSVCSLVARRSNSHDFDSDLAEKVAQLLDKKTLDLKEIKAD